MLYTSLALFSWSRRRHAFPIELDTPGDHAPFIPCKSVFRMFYDRALIPGIQDCFANGRIGSEKADPVSGKAALFERGVPREY